VRGQFQGNNLTPALFPFRRSPVAIGEAVKKVGDRVQGKELIRSDDQRYAAKVDRGGKKKIPWFRCLTPREFFPVPSGTEAARS